MKTSNRRFVPTTAIFRFFNQADNTKNPAPAKKIEQGENRLIFITKFAPNKRK